MNCLTYIHGFFFYFLLQLNRGCIGPVEDNLDQTELLFVLNIVCLIGNSE